MLFGAFDKMRGARTAPNREDLDLKQVRKLMPNLFIAEQDAVTGEFRWRLAATAVSALMGGEVTGSSFTVGWDRPAADRIRRFLSGVSGTHRPALLRLRFMTDRGQWILAEMAAVPLMAADGQSTQVLGGLFTFPDVELKHYDTVTAREVVISGPSSREAAPVSTPEARRFRVITGGRGQG